MWNFLAVVKSTLKFIILFIGLLVILLFWWSQQSTISIDGIPHNFDLPAAIKLTALREREIYFNVWINQIIAPGIQSPEERVHKIFDRIKKFKRPEDFDNKDFHNIEQHEYYTLINQYGYTNQLVRVFCLIVTVAGYQAIPFNSEADGRVVVRIPGTDEKDDKWLKCDLKNETWDEKVRDINLSPEVKQAICDVDTMFEKLWKKKYTRGDQNTLGNRIWFEILNCKILKWFGLSPSYIEAVNNDRLVEIAL